ncbi:hypothetical protein D3C73_1127330 [compost metagenome]
MKSEAIQHRTVHARLAASAHFVPIVSCQLQLGADRHFNLGHGDEIVEASFASDLLQQEPSHLFKRRRLRQPWKKRIVLTGAAALQRFEPVNEFIRRVGQILQPGPSFYPGSFDERAFH